MAEHFIIRERNPTPVSSHFPFPLPLAPATFNLLSVSEELPCLTLHICRIIQHVAFGVWLLSLSKMLSSLIHIVGLQHFLAPGASLMEDKFSTDWNWGVGLVSPTAHLLLCSLVHNRPWTHPCPWPGGWGPLIHVVSWISISTSF